MLEHHPDVVNYEALQPGNYPKDWINRLKEASNIDQLLALCSPRTTRAVVIGFDLRWFTMTTSLCHPPEIMYHFLSELFERASAQIQKEKGDSFVNKFLGDGLLGYFDLLTRREEERRQARILAVKSALEILQEFNNLKTAPGWKNVEEMEFLGLSLVLHEVGELSFGPVGRTEYIDYTPIGIGVNRLFRVLNGTKGSTVVICNSLQEQLKGEFLTVDLGFQVYDGLGMPIQSYSVLRTRTNKEKIEGDLSCKEEDCKERYKWCKKKFLAGKEAHRGWLKDSTGPYPYLNCRDCDPEKRPNGWNCWHWHDCKRKFAQDVYGQFQECCHVCEYYTLCHWNYFLGVTKITKDAEMIKCKLGMNGIDNRSILSIC
ncbi:adenylate/guanylate cyclase domain-containing protein [bacterium]|nr:adenylate/guanylate cyclase domain-containing protein [bacterium]